MRSILRMKTWFKTELIQILEFFVDFTALKYIMYRHELVNIIEIWNISLNMEKNLKYILYMSTSMLLDFVMIYIISSYS